MSQPKLINIVLVILISKLTFFMNCSCMATSWPELLLLTVVKITVACSSRTMVEWFSWCRWSKLARRHAEYRLKKLNRALVSHWNGIAHSSHFSIFHYIQVDGRRQLRLPVVRVITGVSVHVHGNHKYLPIEQAIETFDSVQTTCCHF